MPVVYPPKYILRLDELPKVIEADGVVYPIYLSLADAARLFGITPLNLREWIRTEQFPAITTGKGYGRHYVEVAALNEWIREHSVQRRRERGR